MIRMDTANVARRQPLITCSTSTLSLVKPSNVLLFEKLQREKSFSPLSQKVSLTTSVRPIRGRVGPDEKAVRRNTETYHAVRHLVFAFLFRLKQTVCNNLIYTLEDADVLNFALIRYLRRAHITAPLLVFSELDATAMKNCKIEKLIPTPLNVVNVDDYSHSLVENVNTISATFQDDSLIFVQTSLEKRPSRKKTMRTDDIGRRRNVPRQEQQEQQEEDIIRHQSCYCSQS